MRGIFTYCTCIWLFNTSSNKKKVHLGKEQLSGRSHQVLFAGDSLERSYLFYDRPSTLSSNAPAFRGQSRLSGFCCANGLCVRSQFAHAHIWWKQLRDINYEPKVALSSPDPTSLVGSPGEVPASVHTMRLPGKVPLAGESPGKRDLMWTQGICLHNQTTMMSFKSSNSYFTTQVDMDTWQSQK